MFTNAELFTIGFFIYLGHFAGRVLTGFIATWIELLTNYIKDKEGIEIKNNKIVHIDNSTAKRVIGFNGEES